ncbi:hypothetical protein HPB50_018525 [Hyalomma asiaticum]|uniref:Uncharacterized protein n=1 Tax=Hyalomma asiaticum TaxID=266040 RepID=A0ACB7TAV6_HYAAI|nr:hypothetical protein HPB50_028263 [Hyalomma asiaticum]KAH6943289.1 hypothetical protein HPB50_018525 [Hyalomma asiaticum]
MTLTPPRAYVGSAIYFCSGWKSVLGEMPWAIANHLRGIDREVRTKPSLKISRFLAIKLGYDALGAEANKSKFTLRRGRIEFLRVETDYVSRCLSTSDRSSRESENGGMGVPVPTMRRLRAS